MLCIGRGGGNVRIEDTQLRGKPMKHVKVFIYLGCMIYSDESSRWKFRRKERLLPEHLKCRDRKCGAGVK